MSLVTRTILVALLLTLTACASGPKQAKDKQPGQACVSDDASYANQAFTPTQGVLTFKEVDGVPIKGSETPVCLAPGKHKFKLAVSTDFRKLDGLAELELKPDASYWLRAKLNGSYGFGYAFDFQLLDVTADKRTTVAEFSIPAEAKTFDFIYVPGAVTPVLILPK
jgi:hypothetical protein